MKKILTLVLCWLLAFSAMAENTFKAYSSASVAGGYVTSLNKVDGSFEDVVTQWVASVGTIVPTASTIMQGEKIGVWSGTGAGTLDLQWAATASNTYEASTQVDVQGEDDVSICAYVGPTETGCKLIPALSKIQKVSVVADSVMSSAFYLRLKHTGSDAFNVKVDDGKIEPWTPQAVNLLREEAITTIGYVSRDGSDRVLFKTLETNNSGTVITSSHSASASYTKITFLQKSKFKASASLDQLAAGGRSSYIQLKTSSDSLRYSSRNATSVNTIAQPLALDGEANAGDYLIVVHDGVLSDSTSTNFSITASAISENVVQSWQDGMATTATLSYAQVNALAGLQGLTFSSGYVSYIKSGENLLYSGSLVIGSTSGTEVRIPFPNSLVSSSKAIPSIRLAGDVGRSNSSTTFFGLKALIEPNVGYFTLGSQSSLTNALTKILGNAWLNAGETISFNIEIPIQGWSSTPPLLALPTSKENRFELTANANGSILKTNAGSLIRVTKTGVGAYTIDYSALGLTANPIVKLEEQAGYNIQASTYPRFRDFISVSTTQATIRTGYNSGSTGTLNDMPFTFTLVKAQPDYTAPGVFVGNVQPEWQYDLSVTGTNWNTTRAVGVVYKTASGGYRMRFNIQGTLNPVGVARTSYDVSIAGVTFNTDLVTGGSDGSVTHYRSYSIDSTSTLRTEHVSFASSSYLFSGDVGLKSKPTWAVNTP